jgi:hypothetical protein
MGLPGEYGDYTRYIWYIYTDYGDFVLPKILADLGDSGITISYEDWNLQNPQAMVKAGDRPDQSQDWWVLGEG